MKRYEGMFLFDNTALHQWSDIEAEVRRLCDRIQANLQVCLKFDERKLAFEIKGRKRGTYVLTYFDADPDRIADLERDIQLSEVILRMLVLRSDSLSAERLAELKALPPDQPLQPMSSEGRRGDGGPSRGRREQFGDRAGRTPAGTAVADAVEKKPATEVAAAETVEEKTDAEARAARPDASEAPAARETEQNDPADE